MTTTYQARLEAERESLVQRVAKSRIEHLSASRDGEQAVVTAVDPSGRTVVHRLDFVDLGIACNKLVDIYREIEEMRRVG